MYLRISNIIVEVQFSISGVNGEIWNDGVEEWHFGGFELKGKSQEIAQVSRTRFKRTQLNCTWTMLGLVSVSRSVNEKYRSGVVK